MHISSFDLWVLITIPKLSFMFDTIAFILFIVLIFVIIGCLITVDEITRIHVSKEEQTKIFKKMKNIIFSLVVSIILVGGISKLIPTTEELAFIVGVPLVVNNEDIQSIGSKTLDGVILELDKWIEKNKSDNITE